MAFGLALAEVCQFGPKLNQGFWGQNEVFGKKTPK